MNSHSEQLLEQFRNKFGLNRSTSTGTPIMYALMRTFDKNSEEFCERWSTVSANPDLVDTVHEGFQEVMSRINLGTKEAEVPEQVPQVVAVAVVGYGEMREVQTDFGTDLPRPENYTPFVMQPFQLGDELLDDEQDRTLARMISLMSPQGFAHQLTVFQEGSEVFSDIRSGDIGADWRDMSDNADEEILVGGPMHEKLREGLALACLMCLTGMESGGTDPFDMTVLAIESDFPYLNRVVRALVHAMTEAVDFESFPKELLVNWLSAMKDTTNKLDAMKEGDIEEIMRMIRGDDLDD